MFPLNSAYGKLITVPGRRPKLDLTHFAAQNLRFAGVSSGANFINLFQGTRGTVGGAPTSTVTAAIGQGVSYTGNTDNSTFAGQITAADTNVTMAAIVMFTGGASSLRVIFLNSVGNTGWIIGAFSNNQFWYGAQGGTQNLFGSVSLNVPYFFAYSVTNLAGGGSGQGNAIVKRLDNGSVVTQSTTGAASTGATSGTYQVGNDITNTRPVNGNIAAVMFSATFLSLPQLIKWSDDPWSFWYPTEFGPENFAFIFANSPGGGPPVTSPSSPMSKRIIPYWSDW